jgi:hypothetical protein
MSKVMLMRAVRAYFLGVLAAISIALVTLKTLPTTFERTIPAPLAVLLHIRMPSGLKIWTTIVDASPKRSPVEPQTVGQKKGRSQQSDNAIHLAHKPMHEAEINLTPFSTSAPF